MKSEAKSPWTIVYGCDYYFIYEGNKQVYSDSMIGPEDLVRIMGLDVEFREMTDKAADKVGLSGVAPDDLRKVDFIK